MHFQNSLLKELSSRQARNPSYSLRAFANSVGISPALLSQLLSGQRPLTYRSAHVICQGLSLGDEERKKILAEASASSRKAKPEIADSAVNALSIEEFKRIADWEHYAVLALAAIKNNRYDAKWIASRLGISQQRALDVRKRLEKLGYLVKEKQGFRQAVPPLTTTQDIPSVALQKFHRQNLEKAADSLVKHTVDERYFGSLTIALDPKQLPELKNFLRKLRTQLERKIDQREAKRVYHFAMQLFPIDKD